MMQLDDILAFSADQERGAWFELADPVTGAPTGIRLKLAGPDSETQRKAQIALADELTEMAGADGQASAEARERARLNALARCVLDWEVTENLLALPFSHANVLRLLRAGTWVQAQVDAFAGDRSRFGGLG